MQFFFFSLQKVVESYVIVCIMSSWKKRCLVKHSQVILQVKFVWYFGPDNKIHVWETGNQFNSLIETDDD